MAASYSVNMQRVQELAFKRLWTWAELSRRADLTPATIFALLAGRRKASLRTVYKLARALEVDPAELIKH